MKLLAFLETHARCAFQVLVSIMKLVRSVQFQVAIGVLILRKVVFHVQLLSFTTI